MSFDGTIDDVPLQTNYSQAESPDILMRKESSGLANFSQDFILEIEDEDIDDLSTPPKSKKTS